MLLQDVTGIGSVKFCLEDHFPDALPADVQLYAVARIELDDRVFRYIRVERDLESSVPDVQGFLHGREYLLHKVVIIGHFLEQLFRCLVSLYRYVDICKRQACERINNQGRYTGMYLPDLLTG